MNCKDCGTEISIVNSVVRKGGCWKKNCRKCESKRHVEWSSKNRDKRRRSSIKYARKMGIGLPHPCETCGSLCKKKSAKAFCSEICRFMSHLEKTDSCWFWKGKISKSGYGVFNSKDAAHRTAYRLFNGEIPLTMNVCHSCDVKSCVNPEHLWIGSTKENMQDMVIKDRNPRGEEVHCSKLKNKDISEIRKLFKNNYTQSKIARLYGVTQSNIYYIVRNLSWTHIN